MTYLNKILILLLVASFSCCQKGSNGPCSNYVQSLSSKIGKENALAFKILMEKAVKVEEDSLMAVLYFTSDTSFSRLNILVDKKTDSLYCIGSNVIQMYQGPFDNYRLRNFVETDSSALFADISESSALSQSDYENWSKCSFTDLEMMDYLKQRFNGEIPSSVDFGRIVNLLTSKYHFKKRILAGKDLLTHFRSIYPLHETPFAKSNVSTYYSSLYEKIYSDIFTTLHYPGKYPSDYVYIFEATYGLRIIYLEFFFENFASKFIGNGNKIMTTQFQFHDITIPDHPSINSIMEAQYPLWKHK